LCLAANGLGSIMQSKKLDGEVMKWIGQTQVAPGHGSAVAGGARLLQADELVV